MANIMTKRGALDNIVTYEHYCDTNADLENIPQTESTLGSVAIVLQDTTTGGVGVYIANSQGQWNHLAVISSGEGSSAAGSQIHILAANQYDDTTGIPTITTPVSTDFYLVPTVTTSGATAYNEWIYTNDEWVLVGGNAENNTHADWGVNDNSAKSYINNRPFFSEEKSLTEVARGTLSFNGGYSSAVIQGFSSSELNAFESYLIDIEGRQYKGEGIFDSTLNVRIFNRIGGEPGYLFVGDFNSNGLDVMHEFVYYNEVTHERKGRIAPTNGAPVVVYKIDEYIHKMNVKFLPDTIKAEKLVIKGADQELYQLKIAQDGTLSAEKFVGYVG